MGCHETKGNFCDICEECTECQTDEEVTCVDCSLCICSDCSAARDCHHSDLLCHWCYFQRKQHRVEYFHKKWKNPSSLKAICVEFLVSKLQNGAKVMLDTKQKPQARIFSQLAVANAKFQGIQPNIDSSQFWMVFYS